MPSVNGAPHTIQPADASNTSAHPNPRWTASRRSRSTRSAEFQAIHDEVHADLGERDADYIRSPSSSTGASGPCPGSSSWPRATRLRGCSGPSACRSAKILENMEIGHNVLHGQWDWMNDPNIHSSTWDWDTASTSAGWKHSHNYLHHTYTNVVGKDKDVGYEIMRVDPKQEWEPRLPRRSRCQRAARCSCSSGASRSTTSTSRRSATATKGRRS